MPTFVSKAALPTAGWTTISFNTGYGKLGTGAAGSVTHGIFITMPVLLKQAGDVGRSYVPAKPLGQLL